MRDRLRGCSQHGYKKKFEFVGGMHVHSDQLNLDVLH